MDVSEDREKFDELLEELNINRPKGKVVWNLKQGLEETENIGYPVLVRPSYVLGGQGMEITYAEKELEHYLKNAFEKDKKNPVLIDRYLLGREIEANPRASRTVPYISKVSKVPIVELATRVMLGEKLKKLGYGSGVYKEAELVSVKVPVFSTQKLPEVEVCLGPEMRSTGEVLGMGRNFEETLYKGFVASGIKVEKEKGIILATINPQDYGEFLYIAKAFNELNYKFIATKGTAKLLRSNGSDVLGVKKSQMESLITLM